MGKLDTEIQFVYERERKTKSNIRSLTNTTIVQDAIQKKILFDFCNRSENQRRMFINSGRKANKQNMQ